MAPGEPGPGFVVPEGLSVPPPEPPAAWPGETHSGFAVPEGVTPPAPVPPGPAATGPGPGTADPFAAGFTPAEGIPAVLLGRGMPWQDRMRTMVRLPIGERPAPEAKARGAEGEYSVPVPRILDLTLRIGELLLASGESAEDVETAMFAITRAHGLDRCEATVTFTLISITHQPSLVDDPISLSRIVRRRGTDYTRLAAVFRLVDDITADRVTLEECYGRLAEMRRNRHPYATWQLSGAAGLLAGAASVLVGGRWEVFLLAALGALLGDRLAWALAGRGLPEFYQLLAAATCPAVVGVLLAATGEPDRNELVRAAAVITGGLFALFPGRALVAAVQDGLTGFYITASARLLEVFYLITGITTGVLAVLYIGESAGVSLNPDAIDARTRPLIQLAAAMVLSLAFCVLLQQERHTVLAACLNGGVAWVVYGAMVDVGDMSPFAATAVGAGLVGLFGQLLARSRLTSSLPYITASIGPLLPGGALYFGLLGLAQGDVSTGGQYLLRAATLALAIAVGVNLGSELARLFIGTPGRLRIPVPRRGAKRTRGF
ncbi:threonine/serine ThrE exporter family protein [Streptomyces aidingensis]|uniref:threonine/serine ThrE exporter family protein n=1 Tax=Streptomyces aidingensis TaxID=910347 RepID=UPI003CCC2CD9